MGRKKRARREVSQPKPVARSRLDNKTVDGLCIGFLLLVACILILSNLGNIYLWGDEAATALVSKTVLTHGVPMGSDGLNVFCQMYGKEVNESGIWIWHPWLPFYLLAGFYAVFGVSTFTARLPFALLGIGTVLMIFCFGKSLWRSRRAGVLAAVLMLISVPFLLLVRQCRYYSPSIFFSLAGLYAYTEMLKGRRYAATAFGVSAFLLFHTHYVYCAALLATAVIHSLIYRRDRITAVLLVSGIVAAVCLPWVILFSGMGQTVEQFGSFPGRVAMLAQRFSFHIAHHMFPPTLLILLAICIAAWNCKRLERRPAGDPETRRNLCLLILFILITIAAMSLTAQTFFFRYLAPLIPVFCLISALILESSMRLHPAIGVIALVLLAYKARMPDYLYEITHDYDGPIEGICGYLNANAGPDDVVAVNHEDLPIKFYTKLRVISGVTGEDYSAAKDADWIILRHGLCTRAEVDITRFLMHNVEWNKYERITLDYPDTPFENREDPERHFFRTQARERRVTVNHRIRQ
jgi:4-amino-4-deoxy-L-arabinose transferase-like glycosyltransferase